MAEYYPLISRAVTSLRGGAPEARQAIYARARQALIGQLRGMQPPVPEEAISKEVAALDAAVARIEGEITGSHQPAAEPADTPPPTPPSAQTPPAPKPAAAPAETPPPPVATPAPPVVAARPSGVRPPAPPVANAAPAPARSDRAVFERRSSLPAARPLPPRSVRPTAPARPPAADEAKPVDKPEAVPEPVRVEEHLPELPPPAAEIADEAGVHAAITPALPDRELDEPSSPTSEPKAVSLPVAPTLDADFGRLPDEAVSVAPVVRARIDDGDDRARSAPPVPDILAEEGRGRDEALRPAIPRQTERAPRDLRVWIVAVVALAALAAIAFMAWKLRDNPEELARVPTPTKSEPAAGKIVERADSPPEDADADAAAPAAATPPVASQQNATSATAPQPATEQAIAVAYKAAILVAAPDTPEKVRTYVGTVVWRTESVPEGQNQSLGTAVRADIDVPDAKFQAVMELRKNTEAQFPASHTIDLKFTVGADSPIGNVKQIDVPRMRSGDSASGDPLIGVPVTITSNYFLVGLTRGAAEQRNMEAMRTRGWIDIPMVLENGTPAKITFEKGALGDRIVEDAFTAWNRS